MKQTVKKKRADLLALTFVQPTAEPGPNYLIYTVALIVGESSRRFQVN